MPDTADAIESVFRNERSRIISSLIRLSGSFDVAEEAMQDAFATAVENWREKGIPANPAAWITAVAQRRLIDLARRQITHRQKGAAIAQHFSTVQSSNDLPDE